MHILIEKTYIGIEFEQTIALENLKLYFLLY